MNFCPQCGNQLGRQVVSGRERPACGHCGFIWYADPKVAVCTIPTRAGRVVLVQRSISPGKGKWVFPGGYMDRGETVEQCGLRETYEETGLTVELDGLVGIYSYPQSPVVVIVYHSVVRGGQLEIRPECSDARYFTSAEIPWLELAFQSTTDAMRAWLASR